MHFRSNSSTMSFVRCTGHGSDSPERSLWAYGLWKVMVIVIVEIVLKLYWTKRQKREGRKTEKKTGMRDIRETRETGTRET